MPAALKIDWSEVRAVCVAAGYRAAAEGFGVAEATIRQRAHREGWFEHPAIKTALARRESVSQAVTADERPTAAVTIAEQMNDLNKRTRLGLARGFAAAAEEVGGMDGDAVLECAEKIGHVSRGAGMVHGWRDPNAAAVIAGVVLPSADAVLATLRRLTQFAAEDGADDADAATPVAGRVVG